MREREHDACDDRHHAPQDGRPHAHGLLITARPGRRQSDSQARCFPVIDRFVLEVGLVLKLGRVLRTPSTASQCLRVADQQLPVVDLSHFAVALDHAVCLAAMAISSVAGLGRAQTLAKRADARHTRKSLSLGWLQTASSSTSTT